MILYLFVPYVPFRLHVVALSHIGILMSLFAAEPRSTARLVSLANLVFLGVRLVGFRSRANVFFIHLSCSLHSCLLLFSLSLLSFYWLVV